VLGLSGIRKASSLLIGGESLLISGQTSVHGGGWYGCDPRNRMICMCKFVVTVVIVGTGLLRLHAEKSVFIHNCLGWRAFHVMNVWENQAVKLPMEIRGDMLLRCS